VADLVRNGGLLYSERPAGLLRKGGFFTPKYALELNALAQSSNPEEERRLFYVAITRCKKELFLFTSEKLKSQFVLEIKPFVS
jgi:superfamily I DNA/RNA helicase